MAVFNYSSGKNYNGVQPLLLYGAGIGLHFFVVQKGRRCPMQSLPIKLTSCRTITYLVQILKKIWVEQFRPKFAPMSLDAEMGGDKMAEKLVD